MAATAQTSSIRLRIKANPSGSSSTSPTVLLVRVVTVLNAAFHISLSQRDARILALSSPRMPARRIASAIASARGGDAAVQLAELDRPGGAVEDFSRRDQFDAEPGVAAHHRTGAEKLDQLASFFGTQFRNVRIVLSGVSTS